MISTIDNLYFCFEVTFSINRKTYLKGDAKRSPEAFYAKMETIMEPVIQLMGANDDVYTIIDGYTQDIIYLFRLNQRRWIERLRNLVDKYITFESLPNVGLRNVKKKGMLLC